MPKFFETTTVPAAFSISPMTSPDGRRLKQTVALSFMNKRYAEPREKVKGGEGGHVNFPEQARSLVLDKILISTTQYGKESKRTRRKIQCR